MSGQHDDSPAATAGERHPGNGPANGEGMKAYLDALPDISRSSRYDVATLANMAGVHMRAVEHDPSFRRTNLSHIRAIRVYLDEIERRTKIALEKEGNTR